MILSLFISTCVLIFLLIYGQKFSKRISDDVQAVQSAHQRATVRLGGVAIICGVSVIFFVKFWLDISILILISALPIFLGGLLEDITGKVRPRNRLLAAFFSAGLAVLLTGEYLVAGDFWLFDKLFIYPLIAIPITILISSGISNAFNIIDGINGFSAGIALMIASLLGYFCQLYDEPSLSYFCYIIAISIVPFLLLNFPFGYIFLGDAGAYTLGHLLSWVAIILIFRQPDISAWALLLIFFWPASEMLLSIYRRFMSNTPSGAPDTLHFHQLIMRLIQLLFDGKVRIYRLANPLATIVLLPLAGFPIVMSIFLLENNKAAILLIFLLVVIYLVLYVLLLMIVKSIALSRGNIEIVNSLSHVFTPKVK